MDDGNADDEERSWGGKCELSRRIKRRHGYGLYRNEASTTHTWPREPLSSMLASLQATDYPACSSCSCLYSSHLRRPHFPVRM